MPIPVLREANTQTRVLLLQAPYPGKLKFDGQPSSILHAIAVYAHRLAGESRLDELGWMDPGIPTADYQARFEGLLRSPAVKALCISTTNAAIEEAAWAVKTARAIRGPDLFILVGGPHEDDCAEKAASRIPGVDLSIAGDAEYVLDFVLRSFFACGEPPTDFTRWLFDAVTHEPLRGSRVTMTSPQGSLVLDLPRIQPSDLVDPIWTTKRVRFSVFDTEETLPVLISRGCSYGKCTFCAEPNQAGARVVREDFEWLRELVAMRPGAAVYFQDSIFPKGESVERKLLPLLKELGVEWGAQVYLRALSRPWLATLRDHGCTYLYTGLESASEEILAAIGKVNMNRDVALERLAWMRDLGFRVGISLMFGAISLDGRLLETEATVAETLQLAANIRALGVDVTGFYPNIMTVLAGTELERSLRARGIRLDFYRMPRAEVFAAFEDGGVGYNLVTLGSAIRHAAQPGLAQRLAAVEA